ncbi:hypothetical protein MLD38_039057 [Melastoma candidum]|uniref:Uncharacterized protein n=1 Tax=Melastoma candidum TaxID=119954 RepID=A0ACB9L0V8_9MYRT|nr:hypothetical protein MLD38_039057 [Melastoma candidum]
MGRAPCCAKVGLHRGPWTPREDTLLVNYIQAHGEGQWRNLPKKAGLLRCGKSCRLRWMNYLRPDIKRGNITPAEDELIMRLHSLLGNRWSLIAGRLPGRTDNEIKNYWNTNLSKKLRSQGTNPGSQKGTRKTSKPARQARRQRSDAAEAKIGGGGTGSSCRRREKPRVHLPKAIRVTTAFPHIGNMLKGGGGGEMDPWMGWDNEEGRNRRGQGGVELGDVPGEEGKDERGLEKLYEEYLDVLKAGVNDGLEDHCHLPELDFLI